MGAFPPSVVDDDCQVEVHCTQHQQPHTSADKRHRHTRRHADRHADGSGQRPWMTWCCMLHVDPAHLVSEGGLSQCSSLRRSVQQRTCMRWCMRAQAMLNEATWHGCGLLLTLAHAGPMGSAHYCSGASHLQQPRKAAGVVAENLQERLLCIVSVASAGEALTHARAVGVSGATAARGTSAA